MRFGSISKFFQFILEKRLFQEVKVAKGLGGNVLKGKNYRMQKIA